MTLNQILPWVIFNVFVVGMLVLDLGVIHRKTHEIKVREALLLSAMWIGLALLFNLGVYFWKGPDAALEFLAGYIIEKSLSVDNIFVFLQVFSYFHVPHKYQHKVLFWGILGAIVMRAVFIVTGVALMERFHWVIYIFGLFLIITGIRMALKEEKEIHPERNPVLKLLRRFIPVSDNYEGDRFFTRRNGLLISTPLFIVLLIIESTDVIFAADSIPAILAVTRDTFIVYTSNIFAILGLRALYFAICGAVRQFHYLHYGLSAILVFVGGKMLASEYYKFPIAPSLGIVAFILASSMVASVLFPSNNAKNDGGPPA